MEKKDLKELQASVFESRENLNAIWDTVHRSTRANEGFLAFKDVNKKLDIVASEGYYLNARVDDGFAGRVMDLRRPELLDLATAGRGYIPRGKEDKIKFEYGYPIIQNEEVIGVFLLDFFEHRPDQKLLSTQFKQTFEPQVLEALSREEPWPTYRWTDTHIDNGRDECLGAIRNAVRETVAKLEHAAGGKHYHVRMIESTPEGRMIESEGERGKLMTTETQATFTPERLLAKTRETGKRDSRLRDTPLDYHVIPFPAEEIAQGWITIYIDSECDISSLLDQFERDIRQTSFSIVGVKHGKDPSERYAEIRIRAARLVLGKYDQATELKGMLNLASDMLKCDFKLWIADEVARRLSISAAEAASLPNRLITVGDDFHDVLRKAGFREGVVRPIAIVQRSPANIVFPIVSNGELCGALTLSHSGTDVYDDTNTRYEVRFGTIIATLLGWTFAGEVPL